MRARFLLDGVAEEEMLAVSNLRFLYDDDDDEVDDDFFLLYLLLAAAAAAAAAAMVTLLLWFVNEVYTCLWIVLLTCIDLCVIEGEKK